MRRKQGQQDITANMYSAVMTAVCMQQQIRIQNIAAFLGCFAA